MNGAESLVHTLIAGNITTCFANPGTSEMHFVAALDRIPGVKPVLCLSEGVVAGAADAYFRMAGGPAATLLHCGPGLANALSNLHNARRARSGILNVVGDQATYHRPLDAPLTADTEGWARPVSGFVRTATDAARVGADAAAAITVAQSQIATLILPADTAWSDGGTPHAPLPAPSRGQVEQGVIEKIARVLRGGEPAIMLLGGSALRAAPSEAAARIAAATGTGLRAEMFNARVERGAGRAAIDRIPYTLDLALESLSGIRHLILVEAAPPVGFFAYPGRPGRLWPEDCTLHVLARPEQDGPAALAALADALDAKTAPPRPARRLPQPATGAVGPEAVAQSLAALMPENAVIVEESISFGRGFFPATKEAPPHDWLALTGGAIGEGMPLAVGAAIGAPGRRVINLQADGSAMYTVAALWTQGRERLDITTVLISNRKYAILLHELANVGANPGPTALSMMDLGNPDLDWVRIAEGMGVAAARATTMTEFNELLRGSVSRPGPFLIELMV
ncbi:MAG TPA: acetolactate synthase large subunit [Acetobacteraceae bacterium]|nr:acetolactate synthase large subunit [Acetobacteraceae bacterium]